MNIFKLALVLIFAIVCSASAQSMAETQIELKPFINQTHYMSLPGYLRYRNFLETGHWRPLKDFRWGYQGTRIMLSESTITIDLGELGQMGDNDAMNYEGISLVSKSIKVFPKLQKYIVSWSHILSIGEGKYTSVYESAVVYDRIEKTLQDMTGKESNVTDADIFEKKRKGSK